jgi:hypothetical protein
MPLPISQLSFDQLLGKLAAPTRRVLNEVHIHHTFRPRVRDWRGQSTVEAMQRYHIQVNKWDEIGQHLTIGPDGTLWSGREFASIPASARGFNGSVTLGPFMIEMVGDFDVGNDAFADPQAIAVYRAVAAICLIAKLRPENIRFHNEFNPAKSCPGTALDLVEFRKKVEAQMKALKLRIEAWLASRIAVPRGSRSLLASSQTITHADANAEPDYDLNQTRGFSDWWRGDDSDVTPEQAEIYRQHVVNIRHGRLSNDGLVQSSDAQLDELVASLTSWAQSNPNGHVLLYAHGGLVKERDALEGIVLPTQQRWLANGIYPIYFVWETGLIETWTKADADDKHHRGWVESAANTIFGKSFGRHAWDTMKNSATISALNGGGAFQFIEKLEAVLKSHKKLNVHAVGHSAGSIFIGELLAPLLTSIKRARTASSGLASVALLAPACTIAFFKEKYSAAIASKDIERFAQFGMDLPTERADRMAGWFYKISLLYFVRDGCERDCPPILGLQESVDQDLALNQFFTANNCALIFSPTPASAGDSASRAIRHGDFDNEQVTMNAVLRRILKLGAADIVPDAFQREDWPKPAKVIEADTRAVVATSGTVHALCIGIDSYATMPLQGCVADAQLWARTLEARGAHVHKTLLNDSATKQNIVHHIKELGKAVKSGDTAVIQFAGHGTQITDESGDEVSGKDQAWVPYDYQAGELVIDDEIGGLIDNSFSADVQVVLFTDCCHSGSSTRAKRAAQSAARSNQRVRALPLLTVPGYAEKFSTAQKRWSQEITSRSTDSGKREVHYAACQDHQFAYESNGQGAFTLSATGALNDLSASASYAELAQRVNATFANNADQTPRFNATPSRSERIVFGAGDSIGAAPASQRTEDALLNAILRLTEKVDALGKKVDAL